MVNTRLYRTVTDMEERKRWLVHLCLEIKKNDEPLHKTKISEHTEVG